MTIPPFVMAPESVMLNDGKYARLVRDILLFADRCISKTGQGPGGEVHTCLRCLRDACGGGVPGPWCTAYRGNERVEPEFGGDIATIAGLPCPRLRLQSQSQSTLDSFKFLELPCSLSNNEYYTRYSCIPVNYLPM